MLLLLTLSWFAAAAGTIADLVPPFVLDSESKIGYWEFSGAALVSENSIMLTPPIQYTKGSAWTNVEIPTSDFEINYEFTISEGTEGGGFGLWFISKVGSDGTLAGGPTSFRGFAIIGTVVLLNGEPSLSFNYLESDGETQFNPQMLPEQDKLYNYIHGGPIKIKLSFHDGKVTMYASITTWDNLEELFEKKIGVNYKDNYIGVTAQSDIRTSRIDINSITFSVMGDSQTRDTTINTSPQSSHFTPTYAGRYRSPRFIVTTNESAKLENGIESEGNIDTIFSVIDEINSASFETASYKDINRFIDEQIEPYSQKWHRRTLKVIESVRESRNIMGATWNYTQEIIGAFNSTLKENVLKTSMKIMDLGIILVKENEDVPQELELLEQQSGGKTVKVLTYITYFEFALVIIAFLASQLPSVKERNIFA